VKTSPESILRAAYTCFARYGYKRVALEQIAAEAGISRAALYLHFKNKEAIFRALARQVHERAQAAVEDAAARPGTLDAQLEAILQAKLGQFFALVHDTPHAAEILDEKSRLCGDLTEEFRKRFLRVLRDAIVAAGERGEIDLAWADLDPGEAAELLHDAAQGLERAGLAGTTPARHRRRLARLVAVFVQGLKGPERAKRATTGTRAKRARGGGRPRRSAAR
jgi:AcrR family transcriptional regulator